MPKEGEKKAEGRPQTIRKQIKRLRLIPKVRDIKHRLRKRQLQPRQIRIKPRLRTPEIRYTSGRTDPGPGHDHDVLAFWGFDVFGEAGEGAGGERLGWGGFCDGGGGFIAHFVDAVAAVGTVGAVGGEKIVGGARCAVARTVAAAYGG